MTPRFSARLQMLGTIALIVTGCGGVKSSAGAHVPVRSQTATIMLDWYPNSDHGGLYTAINKGYFTQYGIEAIARTPSSSTSQISVVAAGRADFGISYETDVLAARVQHVPVRSVMCIMQHPLDTVMALKASGITRPRDLVGKKIGMAGSPSDNPIVSAMMRRDGAFLEQAQMVNVGYNLLPALLSRKVDAVVGVYWTWEAIQAREKGYPVNVMRVERWGVPNYCELVLVANEKTISSRPTYLRHVVHALQEGYRDAEANPNVAWQALHAKDQTLNRALVLESLRLLRPVVTDASPIGHQSVRQWKHYASWLFTNKLIAKPVEVSKAFTNAFVGHG